MVAGTSWYAALLAEYIIEELCRIPVEVEYASEFRYRNPIINKGDIIVAISQSGETADTRCSHRAGQKERRHHLRHRERCGFFHRPYQRWRSLYPCRSGDRRCLHQGLHRAAGRTGHDGPEGSQGKGTISDERYRKLLYELESVPEKVGGGIEERRNGEKIAEKYKGAGDALFLGRGYNFPIALEGALKLKEISYIHAEGYPAAEMKHGPIALVDEKLPVIFIATKDSYHEKIVSNIQEIKARKGKVIAIVTEGDDVIPWYGR